eukprot:GHVO01027550.1.p1 GENE.GHVO01027550.1~~GHVO01027550.1.p1  ORF type:complete len:610 (+),score=121.32 GHVO01027550.1:36-1865(+)
MPRKTRSPGLTPTSRSVSPSPKEAEKRPPTYSRALPRSSPSDTNVEMTVPESAEKPVEPEDPELEAYKRQKITKVTTAELTRTGGVYVPPFKLQRMMEGEDSEQREQFSEAFQRLSWEALRKSFNGLINKVNATNITDIVQDIFSEDLIRGRGLFARAVIRAQMASPSFTPVYATLVAIVNSKLPEVGELIIHRVLLQFRRSYRRNIKIVTAACLKFIGHLANQKVVTDTLVMQVILLLLEQKTDDSVEVALGILQESGALLKSVDSRAHHEAVESFRRMLVEGTVSRRVQNSIEAFLAIVATGYKDYPIIPEDLDVLHEEDVITHTIDLFDEEVDGHEMLNIFRAVEPKQFEEDEKNWKEVSASILGGGGDESGAEEEEEGETEEPVNDSSGQIIRDYTQQDLVNLRRTVYLAIQSSATFEECVHKLMKMNIQEGLEIEVIQMLLDCCSMERTYDRFYSLQAERLSRLKPAYKMCCEDCFRQQYETVYKLETPKIRHTAMFFSHLLCSGAISWSVLACIILTEESTTSASRIFAKVLFQDMAEQLGHEKLAARLHDPEMEEACAGLFPTDHPRNVRFAINYFTAIGLGGLTEDLRALLAAAQTRMNAG